MCQETPRMQDFAPFTLQLLAQTPGLIFFGWLQSAFSTYFFKIVFYFWNCWKPWIGTDCICSCKSNYHTIMPRRPLNFISLIPAVHLIQLSVIKFVSELLQFGGFLKSTPFSSTKYNWSSRYHWNIVNPRTSDYI